MRRTPALHGLEVGSWTVTAPSGARLTILPADGAGAFGLLPSWVVLDEFFWWPDTAQRRMFWTALSSSLGKVPDARLTILSTPGDPASWTAEVYRQALRSDRWRVSEMPGPLPWVDPAYLADEEARLLPSMYRRLHLAEWAESEESLTTVDDVLAACRLDGPIDYEADRKYALGVDLGVVRDATGVAIAHLEGADGEPPRVVVERIARWRGTGDQPVEISEVEGWIEQAMRTYHRPRIVLDTWQTIGLGQRLRGRGASVVEFNFSQQGTGKLAQALFTLLRSRRIDMPNDPQLVDELKRTQLIETSPGRFQMETPRREGSHGDLVVAIGLAAVQLLERGGEGKAVSVHLLDLRREARDREAKEAQRHLPFRVPRDRVAHYTDKNRSTGRRTIPPPSRTTVNSRRERSR